MNFNRELRTKSMNIRFHILWVIFYFFIITAFLLFAYKVYHEHSENEFPAGNIELSVSKKRYQPGEDVVFSINNKFPTTVYVTNNCPEEPLDVYRWENEKWIKLHDIAVDTDSTCYKQPRRIAIAANGSLGYNFKDWPNLFKDSGIYRLAMNVEHLENVPYVDFVILKKPETIRNAADTPATKSEDTSARTPTPKSEPNAESSNTKDENEREIEIEREIDDD